MLLVLLTCKAYTKILQQHETNEDYQMGTAKIA